jgi:ABC-type branched-subunit amino acid transport system ATPase component
MSVLLVEHDINVVMRISYKVVVLDYGTKIADGSPLEVQNNRDVLNAYLGGVL